MKTFRMIGLALFAILLCVNFTSCSSNDDNEPEIDNESGVVTNEKKLIEMKMDEGSEVITWAFSYDEKGRLTTIKGIEIDDEFDDDNTFYRNITWGDGVLFYKCGHNNITFTLDNGLIKSAESENGDLMNATFTYNSSKQLITFKEVEDYDTYVNNFTWESDRLAKITDEDGNVIQLSYDNKTCKGYCPILSFIFAEDMVDDNEFFAAHPELIGLRTNKLLSKAYEKWEYGEDSYEENTIEFSYTFTNDGYIESCTIKETEIYNGEEDVDITIWTFKWR